MKIELTVSCPACDAPTKAQVKKPRRSYEEYGSFVCRACHCRIGFTASELEGRAQVLVSARILETSEFYRYVKLAEAQRAGNRPREREEVEA